MPTFADDMRLASLRMGSRTYRAEAIVLKTLDLGEAEMIAGTTSAAEAAFLRYMDLAGGKAAPSPEEEREREQALFWGLFPVL